MKNEEMKDIWRGI